MTGTDNSRALAQQVVASRRGLMCGVAALGAGALAACGRERPSSESSGGSEPSADPDTPLAQTSEVPVGEGIVVDQTVIVQPTADEFLAFSAACPHQETIVDPPNDEGVIVCSNHGSQFDMEGGLLQGPAETGLTEVEITVEDGAIYRA